MGRVSNRTKAVLDRKTVRQGRRAEVPPKEGVRDADWHDSILTITPPPLNKGKTLRVKRERDREGTKNDPEKLTPLSETPQTPHGYIVPIFLLRRF